MGGGDFALLGKIVGLSSYMVCAAGSHGEAGPVIGRVNEGVQQGHCGMAPCYSLQGQTSVTHLESYQNPNHLEWSDIK